MAFAENRDHGWAAYVWLVFLAFFFLQPIFGEHTTGREWVITLSATALFLVTYFAIFRVGAPWNRLLVLVMVAMGIGLGRLNQGASVFIIYAACFIAWVVSSTRQAFIAMAALVVVIGLDAWLFRAPFGFSATALVTSLGVGLSNVYFAERERSGRKLLLAHEEIEHLAKVAERERIARDLHDVLGHTLSLIIVKSALATKLLDKHPEKAKSEIADIERVSRQAMGEIRSTLRGASTYKLNEEMERAKSTLGSAGIRVESETSEVGLSPAQESVVALIMREAVTNVVRHAQAGACRLSIAQNNGSCVLEVEDDGRGGCQIEGNGMRGMRERIEALGGTFYCESGTGTKLRFEFPLVLSSNARA